MVDESHWLMDELPNEIAAYVTHCGDLATAWRHCPKAEWLMRMALAGGVGRATVVRAGAELVSDAIATSRARRGAVADIRVQRALLSSLAWVGGRESAKKAWALGFGANESAEQHDDPMQASAARAASCIAFACDEDADDVFYAHRGYVVKAVEHAANVVGVDTAADRVRAEIPLAAFLEAVASGTEVRLAHPPLTPVAESTDSFYC